ncbi:MAG: DUF5309 family protein [Phycisphaerae bacterium]|nr:DUF5309 family protein [Phycisphaerae bacterium]
MSFTGRATYSSGISLPEAAEDVSDIVGIISPYETSLLNALDDPMREAISTHHEWLEDELLPNKDVVLSITTVDGINRGLVVQHKDRFRVGDQLQIEGSEELMLVESVFENCLTVQRGYAGTKIQQIQENSTVNIIGNAAIEGGDKPQERFIKRVRRNNYTQIFTAAVEVSGADVASSQLGIADEMDYQKQERLRGLIRDLENSIINGKFAEGKMMGIIQHLKTNFYTVGDTGLPAGNDLDEAKINYVLRQIWENSNGNVDLIVTGGYQKRMINSFSADSRSYGANDTTFTDMISIYESDFGICRIVTTQWMPQDAALLLDSSRISVLPLAGRSFYFKPLASSGDYEYGELIGEYTLELRNEAAHGIIRGLRNSG